MAHICGLNSSLGPTELQSLEKSLTVILIETWATCQHRSQGSEPAPPPLHPAVLHCVLTDEKVCVVQPSPSPECFSPAAPANPSTTLLPPSTNHFFCYFPPFITWQILIHLFKPTWSCHLLHDACAHTHMRMSHHSLRLVLRLWLHLLYTVLSPHRPDYVGNGLRGKDRTAFTSSS